MCIFNNMPFGPPAAWSCAFIPACPLTNTELVEADGTRDPLKAPGRTEAEEPGLIPRLDSPAWPTAAVLQLWVPRYHHSIPRDWAGKMRDGGEERKALMAALLREAA